MSTGHLQRMIQEEEHRKENECLDEEEPLSRRVGPLNRFAILEDNDEVADNVEDCDSHKSEGADEDQHTVARPKTKGKRKTNKKKNRQKGKEEEELDGEQLLDKLLDENRAAVSSTGKNEKVEVAQLLKPDPRLFDATAELKRALGKSLKGLPASSSRPHNSSHAAGRIVKLKNTWPPIRNIGLSLQLVREEGEVKWFKFVHNSHYDTLERLCLISEDSFDHVLIEEILVSNPYHSNSLMLLANAFRMQEDVTKSCDLIERGIFYCDQCMSNKFQPSSFYHRMDYLEYENRAFYLLLHRHMLNCVHRRCFETALNYAKLILKMDPQNDPLAILLLIDTIAIKGKQYKWLKDFYDCCKEWKNLDKLPNFCYSTALAQFLGAKTDGDLDVADHMLSFAICAFPGVVTMLLDKLQIEPDALVESHRHLSTFAINKETDGLKLIFKIYVNEVAELWKVPETLSWLEHVTRKCAQSEYCSKEMEIWREKRQRLFVGVPQNIRRLAVLLGLESSSSAVTDPVPPSNRRPWNLPATANTNRSDSFLSGLFSSVVPELENGENIRDIVERLTNSLHRALFPSNTSNTNDADEAGQESEE